MDLIAFLFGIIIEFLSNAMGNFGNLFSPLNDFRGIVAFFAAFAVILGFGRLLAYWIIRPEVVVDSATLRSLTAIWAFGLAFSAFSAGWWAWGGIPGGDGIGIWVAPCAVLFAIVGAFLMAYGLGRRLRIEVTVTGSDGSSDAAGSQYVLASIEQIGAGRPRGLDYPHGSDASAFVDAVLTSGATSDAPKWLSAILNVARGLVIFPPPWQIEVSLPNPDTAAVRITRNGRKADTELINYASFLPSSPKEPAVADVKRVLLSGVAAFSLMTLTRAYPDLRDGLAGATSWRSVTRQVLASLPPWTNDSACRRYLLAKAVDEDPGNKAAWLGYLVNGRFGGSEKSLKSLTAALEELRNSLDGEADTSLDMALRIRLLHVLTNGYSNLRLKVTKDMQAAVIHQGLEAATALMQAVDQASSDQSLAGTRVREFARRMQPVAAQLYLHVHRLQDEVEGPLVTHTPDLSALAREWDTGDIRTRSLQYLYSRACNALEVNSDHSGALRDLEIAFGLDDLKDFAASDPSFRALRSDPAFMAMASTRPRLKSLEGFKVHASALESQGIHSPADLLKRFGSDGQQEWAKTLKVSEDTVEWMKGLCTLEESCPDRAMAIVWTNLLGEEDIDDPEALVKFANALGDPSDDIYNRLVATADLRSIDPPRREEIRSWARTLLDARGARPTVAETEGAITVIGIHL